MNLRCNTLTWLLTGLIVVGVHGSVVEDAKTALEDIQGPIDRALHFFAAEHEGAITNAVDSASDVDATADEARRELTGCVPSRQVAYENFENGSLYGWTNGKIASAPVFTKFLGRYGKHDRYPRDPYKTFGNIPRNADYVEFKFDFYEIDSWDASHGDYLCVVFDGKQVDLGRFDTHQNENGRSATRQGISFRIQSQAAPRNIGFNSRWKDQIHHVTMRIPNRFFMSSWCG